MMYLSFNKSRYKEIILRQQSSCTGRWPMTFYVSLGSSSFGFSKHRNLATAVLPCQTCSTAKVEALLMYLRQARHLCSDAPKSNVKNVSDVNHPDCKPVLIPDDICSILGTTGSVKIDEILPQLDFNCHRPQAPFRISTGQDISWSGSIGKFRRPLHR